MNNNLKSVLEKSKESQLIETELGRIAKDRSVGVVLFVWWFNHRKKQIEFLICKRGTKTTEYKSAWNLPSGYLNWNETGEEGAARECWEECGVEIDPEKVTLAEVSTKPDDNQRQNVILRYITQLNQKPNINLEVIDKQESVEIEFITEKEVEKYEFAWKQKETIYRLLKKAKLEMRIYMS